MRHKADDAVRHWRRGGKATCNKPHSQHSGGAVQVSSVSLKVNRREHLVMAA